MVNYKGNHNEHVEVNRLLKNYNEKDIPYSIMELKIQ